MPKPKKSGLGKGLDALFLDNGAGEDEESGSLMLRVSEIEPNRRQPRKDFDENALAELADSIREHGILQPLLVRKMEGGGYQLVAGERRWRAARMVGLDEVPVLVREMSEAEVMEFGLVENLQREDLNPLEEASGYQELVSTYGLTQEQVAKRMGKSRPVIANALRILNLSPGALERLEKGELTPGHARVLAGLESHQLMDQMAAEVVKASLTVRQLEKLAAQAKKEAVAPAAEKKPKEEESAWGDSGYREVEISLAETLGRKVKIRRSPRGGILEIEFYSMDDLKRLAEHMHWN